MVSPFGRAIVLALFGSALFTTQGCQTREQPAPEGLGAPAPAAAETFGAPLTTRTPAASLAQLIEAPLDYAGRSIIVEGTVRRACSRKGCWMELAEGLDDAAPGCRVTFKDYGFFVPLDSQGARATVEGEVRVKRVPRARVEHLEAEGAVFASKNPDGTASEVQLVATGVELVR